MTSAFGSNEVRSELPETAIIESWNSIEDKSVKLADVIGDDIIESGRDFDMAIVVSRGGDGVANITLRRLSFKSPAIYHVGLSSYGDGETTSDHELVMGQMPTAEEVEGKYILIIDEVSESGESLYFLTQLLEWAGAKETKTAVIHYKPESAKMGSGFIPTWYIQETEEWVHYEWEKHDKAGLEFERRKEAAGVKAAERVVGVVVRTGNQDRSK
ncbi:MAG TPA: phosphoribosyltransferase [Patescibacteria group bacterium]|nr:phosphoribosyltransferase [Patescibacteria group bacterium]